MDLISVTGPLQAGRMLSLGAEQRKIRISKNAKYGNLIKRTRECKDIVEQYRSFLSLEEGVPVFLAGSIRGDEVSGIIEVCSRLKHISPHLVSIVAPRHMPRIHQLGKAFKKQGMPFQLWSRLKVGREKRRYPIVLVDTLGDLFYLYASATVVFCGGSLVDMGGQNVMEPAAWGKAPLYGRHMDDFLDAAEDLEKNQAGIRVKDNNELIEKVLWFINNPREREEWGRRAFTTVLHHEGAGRETVQLMLSLL